MKNFYTLLCLLASFFLFNNAYTQDRKIERKVYYDSSAKSYFRYIKDPSHLNSWTIEKLLSDRKTRNGSSIEYFLLEEKNNKQDTLKFISFYRKGIRAPLRLNAYTRESGFLENIFEETSKENIEPWRNALYRIYTKGLSDSMRLYYLRAKDTVFTEDYYLGHRLSRAIRKKAVFDSLFATTQTSGAEIFYANCSSCHNPFKDATGPKLAGLTKRRSEAWLKKWIRNSAAMIADNDHQAVALYHLWHNTAMTSFPMPEAEMDKLIDFLKTL